ncbi:MAG: RecX family transcriptional regulator [Ruminococcus sp.]|nr:RecX family transcriptional regulator [Ruminococcus sp.]
MKVISVSRYKGTTFQAVLDDGRTLYLHSDIIADFSVRPEMEINTDELKKIVYASNFRRAFQRALFLLDYRDYSSAEMLEKLTATYKSEKLCSAVIKKLTDNGLINDRRFAERLAQKLVETKKYGYRRAKREIMQKGIDKFTADDALSPYSEMYSENIMHLLKTKHSRWLTDESDRKNIEKVKNALVRYGYDFTEINLAVKDYFEEDN